MIESYEVVSFLQAMIPIRQQFYNLKDPMGGQVAYSATESFNIFVNDMLYVQRNMQLEAPSQADLDTNPALKNAWDEFQLVRKLTK